MGLDQKQRGVVLRVPIAGIIVGIIMKLALHSPPAFLLPKSEALILPSAARWGILPSICVAILILRVGMYRFFSPKDIDGSGLRKGTPEIQILRAILENTVEQTVIATVAYGKNFQ